LQKCFDFLLSCSQKNHSLSSYLELIYLCANLQKSGVLLLRDCSYNHSSVCSSDERAFQCLYCISIMFLTFSLFTQFYSRQNCVNHYSTCFYGKLGLSSIRTSKIASYQIYVKECIQPYSNASVLALCPYKCIYFGDIDSTIFDGRVSFYIFKVRKCIVQNSFPFLM